MASPTRVGRFEIVRELGRGAMGLVYLAHDPKIDRKVAIKTIQRNPALQETEAEEARQRFLREAQAAGKLVHSGIVTIFDVGEDQGTSYIAMEYIEGNTLEAATKPDHLMPVEKVVRFITQAAHALDYAHEHHIVHRDIKPANLMIVGDKQLKVTDFGLAKNPSANLTSAGTLIGTPNYMSPEQIMGRSLDGRSDLFSLGVVLYELLTGERPFGGETISTIIYRILHELPKTPDIVNPRVPAALSQVILRAIEKDAAKRYQTGDEFAGALQAYIDSVSAPQLSAAMRASSVKEAPTTLMPSDQFDPGAAAGGPPARSPAAVPATRPAAKAAPRAALKKTAPVAPVKRRSRALPLTLVILLGAAGAGVYVFFPQIAPLIGMGRGTEKPPESKPSVEPPAPRTPAQAPIVDLPKDLPKEVVSIRVDTEPGGGRIYVDDREVTAGTITLPRGDTATHTAMAESECFRDSRPVRAGGPDSLVIKLKTPRLHSVRVTSEPSGARLSLDGRDIGTQAPADVNVPACQPHTLAARLSGYKATSQSFDAKTVWASVSPVGLTLEKLPDGSVLVKGPYPLEVFEGSRQIGSSGAPITLPAGRHALRVVNSDLFVDLETDVDVPAGGTASPRVELPGVGQLTVHAKPSNGMVYVNGRKIGAPPILGYSLREGTHVIKVLLDSGQSKEETVLIIADQPITRKFIF